MAPTIERAPSGRAKCRGCGQPIAKGDLRLGARLANPFDETKELTLWFHPRCGACTRGEVFLEAARTASEELPDRDSLEAEARRSVEYPRLERLRGAERARTGRATCRSCREAIRKDAWRLALTFYDEVEGRFSPGGFLHAGCAGDYFGTSASVLGRVKHFTPELAPSDIEELKAALGAPS